MGPRVDPYLERSSAETQTQILASGRAEAARQRMLAGADVSSLRRFFLSRGNVLVKRATKSCRSVCGLGATPPKEPLALIRSL